MSGNGKRPREALPFPGWAMFPVAAQLPPLDSPGFGIEECHHDEVETGDPMTHYPLLFGGRELVEGNGFIARVTVSGRALLTEENGEVWVEGINPGGFSARGANPNEALAEFYSAFRAVLFDIASDARGFQDFSDEVQRFFHETSLPASQEWEQAVQRVKAGQLDAEWLNKRPAETKLGIEVTEVSRPAATNNELGDAALAA